MLACGQVNPDIWVGRSWARCTARLKPLQRIAVCDACSMILGNRAEDGGHGLKLSGPRHAVISCRSYGYLETTPSSSKEGERFSIYIGVHVAYSYRQCMDRGLTGSWAGRFNMSTNGDVPMKSLEVCYSMKVPVVGESAFGACCSLPGTCALPNCPKVHRRV